MPQALLSPSQDYTTSALHVHAVDVVRGEVVLCHAVGACIEAGQIWHVQGVNGIGKSSFLLMLAGLITPSAGKLSWHRTSAAQWPTLYIGHAPGINPQLTVIENLQFLLALSPHIYEHISRAQLHTAIDAVGLQGYAQTVVGKLSSGQKRRVMLACLWLCKAPVLWLLDEPFTALDAAMAARLNKRLQEHATQGGRVILTSHQAIAPATHYLDLTQYRFNPLLLAGQEV